MAYAIFGRTEDGWEPAVTNGNVNPKVYYTRGEAGKDIAQLIAGNLSHIMVRAYDKYKADVYPDAVVCSEAKHVLENRASDVASIIRRNISDGELYNVPWHKDLVILDSMKWHTAHINPDDNTLVTYFASAEDIYDRKASNMTAARYLIKFYCMSNDTASDWAARMNALKAKLMFAHTPDDIERVYTNGPSSCMSHGTSHFQSDVHPCRIYGAGDLAIAYITAADNAKRITARALCWPAKRIYGRTYGDTVRLKALLQAHGMSYASEEFDGARLLRIPHGDVFVGPYLDCGDEAHDDGHNIIVGDAPRGSSYETLCARNLTGILGEQSNCYCDCCEQHFDDEDINSYTVGNETWCEHCFDNYGVLCDDCNDGIHRDNAMYVDSSTAYVCEYCYERNYAQCDVCENVCNNDDIAGSTVDDKTICNACAEEYVQLDDSGEYIESDQASECAECGACCKSDDMAGTLADGGEICQACEPKFALLESTGEYVKKSEASDCTECGAVCITDDMVVGGAYDHAYCSDECMSKDKESEVA